MNSNSPSADALAHRDVRPITEDSDLSEVVARLKANRVAILVDREQRPISILTVCDIDRVLERTEQLLAKGTRRAGELFPTKSPTYVYTVRTDEPLELVADQLLERGLGTGITVVDARGVYVGYIYADEVRSYLRRGVEQRKRELRNSAKQLESRFPDAESQLNKWLGPPRENA